MPERSSRDRKQRASSRALGEGPGSSGEPKAATNGGSNRSLASEPKATGQGGSNRSLASDSKAGSDAKPPAEAPPSPRVPKAVAPIEPASVSVLSQLRPELADPACGGCPHSTAGVLGESLSCACLPLRGGVEPLASPWLGWADPYRIQERTRDAVLCVHVHGCDRILPDPYVLHPFVRVTLIDETTGRLALREGAAVGGTRVAPPPQTDEEPSSEMRKLRSLAAGSNAHQWLAQCSVEPTRTAVLNGGNKQPKTAVLDVVPPQATSPSTVIGRKSATEAARAENVGLGLSGYSHDTLASWEQSLVFAGGITPALQRQPTTSHPGSTASSPRVARSDEDRRCALGMVRPADNLAALVRPGVIAVFELLDHGPSLPEHSVRASDGLYPIAWGFVRLVAEDDSPRVNVDARPLVTPRERGVAPVAVGDALAPKSEEDDEARAPPGWTDTHDVTGDAKSRMELDRIGQRVQVRMFRWREPRWFERQAHLRSIEHTAAHGSGLPRGLIHVPSSEANLQYRLRGREEVPFTLTVSLTAALVSGMSVQQEAVVARLLSDLPSGSLPDSLADHADRSHPATPVPGDDDTQMVLSLAAARLSKRLVTLQDIKRGAKSVAAVRATSDPTASLSAAAKEALLRRRKPTEPCKVPTSYMGSLPSARNGCLCLSFSEDGMFLAAACVDSADHYHPLQVFDPNTSTLIAEGDGHTGLVYDVKWQPALKAPGTPHARASLLSHTSLEEGSTSSPAHASHASRGSDRPSQYGLLSASADGTVRVWRFGPKARSMTCVATLTVTPPSFVYSASFHPMRPDIIVSGSFDGFVRLWQLVPSDTLRDRADVAAALPSSPPAPPRGFEDEEAVSEGRLPWSFGGGVFPPGCRGTLAGVLGATSKHAGVSSARRGGASLLTSSQGAMLQSPSLKSPSLQSPPKSLVSVAGFTPSAESPSPHRSNVNSVRFHPSGGRLFTADADGMIVIWDCGRQSDSPSSYSVSVCKSVGMLVAAMFRCRFSPECPTRPSKAFPSWTSRCAPATNSSSCSRTGPASGSSRSFPGASSSQSRSLVPPAPAGGSRCAGPPTASSCCLAPILASGEFCFMVVSRVCTTVCASAVASGMLTLRGN
jgi:WD40 repeat protein